MRKLCISLTALCVVFYGVLGFTISFAAGFVSESRDMETDFEAFTKSINHDYQEFVTAHERSYADFKREIEAKWGAFKDSTVTAWVDYSDDLNTRSSVDFKEGLAHFEALLHEDSLQAKAEALRTIQEQMRFVNEQCLENAGFEIAPLHDMLDIPQESSLIPDTLPVLQNLLSKEGIRIMPNILEAQHKLPHHQEKSPSRPRTNKEKAPYTMTVQVALPTDYLQQAANKYKSLVYENGSRFSVKSHIIYAIIHTESYFNPFARSHVPAFGLMQLVPSSGGKDAYEYIYKKSVKPSAQFLYNPNNNILLGTAYLSKIRDVYFKGIHNEESAYIVSVAAYNTGVGNVARALTGTKSLSKAVAKVNSMTPKQVYTLLLKHLPYDETKKYLENVLNRSAMYRGV